MQYVSEGNTTALMDFLLKHPPDGALGLHSNNPLRNQKNLFISFVPMISHAAIEGGLDWELALSLSDYYIQSVEGLVTIKDIMELTIKVLYDYSNRVNQLKQQNHSKIIRKCENYIFKHLFEKISLNQLAENVNMNASYLSDLFKRELGLSITEYILRMRIEEAKRQMVSTDHTLADIYESLCFHDQSHFTKVFKKIVGVTPKKYISMNKQ